MSRQDDNDRGEGQAASAGEGAGALVASPEGPGSPEHETHGSSRGQSAASAPQKPDLPPEPEPVTTPESQSAWASAENLGAVPPPPGERADDWLGGDLAATIKTLIPWDRPEIVIGAAFLAGYLVARLLKRLAR